MFENSGKVHTKTRKYHFWLIGLAVICLLQGGFIFFLLRSSTETQKPIGGDLSRLFHESFLKQKENHFKWFDRHFDHNFFSSHESPFKEMERFHNEMSKKMDEAFRHSFNESWDGWIASRFSEGLGGIEIETKETDKAYVYTVKLPNLKENRLNVSVEAGSISIDGEYAQMIERKDANGDILGRQERRQSVSKRLSPPEDADYDNTIIENRQDSIVITVPKKSISH